MLQSVTQAYTVTTLQCTCGASYSFLLLAGPSKERSGSLEFSLEYFTPALGTPLFPGCYLFLLRAVR